MVTVLDRLPRNLKYLKDLATELKKKCGTGGTFKMDAEGGQIEIQGDRRETIRDLLGKKGIPFKG